MTCVILPYKAHILSLQQISVRSMLCASNIAHNCSLQSIIEIFFKTFQDKNSVLYYSQNSVRGCQCAHF